MTRTAVAPFEVGLVAKINLILLWSLGFAIARICPADILTWGALQPDSLRAFSNALMVAAVAQVNETCALTRLGGWVSGVDHNLNAIARHAKGTGGSPAETIIGARTSGGGGRGGRAGSVGGK